METVFSSRRHGRRAPGGYQGTPYGTPPLGRQGSVDGLHFLGSHPSASSCSGSSSWVLWRDVGTPYCETRRRRGRLCSVLLALAVLFVVLTVLGIAALAVYMGALRIDTSKSELVFEGGLRLLSEERFLPALRDNSSSAFRERAHRYQSMLEAVFRRSPLRAALRSCSVQRFDHNGSLVLFFRLHLDRRKIPRTLLNVEDTAKEILVEEMTSLKPVAFRNVLVDTNSIFIKRFLEDETLQTAIPPRAEGDGEEVNRTLEVRNGVLLKAPPTSPPSLDTSPPAEAHEEIQFDKSIPVVEGSYTITKSEASLTESKPSHPALGVSATEPHLVTRPTQTESSSNKPSENKIFTNTEQSDKTDKFTGFIPLSGQHNILSKRTGEIYSDDDESIVMQTENIINQPMLENVAAGFTTDPVALRTNTYYDRYKHHSIPMIGIPSSDRKQMEEPWRPHDRFDGLAVRRGTINNSTLSTLAPHVSEEPWRPIMSGTGVAEVVPIPEDVEMSSRQHSTGKPHFTDEDNPAAHVGKEAFKPQYHEHIPPVESREDSFPGDKLSTISLHILGAGTAVDSSEVSILHTSSSGGIIVKKQHNHTEMTPAYSVTMPTLTFPHSPSPFQPAVLQLEDATGKRTNSNEEGITVQKHDNNQTKTTVRTISVTMPTITYQPPVEAHPNAPRTDNKFAIPQLPLLEQFPQLDVLFHSQTMASTSQTVASVRPHSNKYTSYTIRVKEKDNATKQPVLHSNHTKESILFQDRTSQNKSESSISTTETPLNNITHEVGPDNLHTTSGNAPSSQMKNRNTTDKKTSSDRLEFDKVTLIYKDSNITSSPADSPLMGATPFPLVTLLPVRSYLGGPLRPRPKQPPIVTRNNTQANGTVTGQSQKEDHLEAKTAVNTSSFTNDTEQNEDRTMSPANKTEGSSTPSTPTAVDPGPTSGSTWQTVTIVKSASTASPENITATTVSSTILNTEVVTSTTVEISFSENITDLINLLDREKTNLTKDNITDLIILLDREKMNLTKDEKNTKINNSITEFSNNSNKDVVSLNSTTHGDIKPELNITKILFQPAVPVPLLTKVRGTEEKHPATANHRQPKMNAPWFGEIPSRLLVSPTPPSVDTSNTATTIKYDRSNASTRQKPQYRSHDIIPVPTKRKNLTQSANITTEAFVEVNMNFTITSVATKFNTSKTSDELLTNSTITPSSVMNSAFSDYNNITTPNSVQQDMPATTDSQSNNTTPDSVEGDSEYSKNMEKSYASHDSSGNNNATIMRVLNAISKYANVHTNSQSAKPTKDNEHPTNTTSVQASLIDGDTSTNANEIRNSSTRAEEKDSSSFAIFPLLTKIYNKIPVNREPNMTVDEQRAQLNGNLTGSAACSGNRSLRCGDGECISAMSRCNQLVNCNDGADERDCSCADYLRAQFLTRKLCDGVVDCWDYTDENNCEWCSPGQFVCPNSQVCVDQQRLCDGARDCPYGDDERQCVTVSETEASAGDFPYHSEGFLMVRKQGRWGKLCLNNLENVVARSQATWQVTDLGRAVCKAMTYSDFDRVDRTTDEPADGRADSSSYYELTYAASNTSDTSPRSGLAFHPTDCPHREVVHVSCRDLECGVRPQAVNQWARSRSSRIVGGGNAGPGSWPWQAALYKEGEFQCGATLISQSWLVSAGHCFYHALDDYWVARLGALRRGTNFPSPYEQQRPIHKIILHPGYIDTGFINDISLLRMHEPVAFSDYVRPICLPQPAAELRDSRLCTVVGWGQLFEVGRIFPDTLQEVQLPVISTAECRKRTLFLPLYRVTDNMFCAGFDRGGRDACLGDSGGPLMCQETDGHWTLYGVTSNGYGCARANRPGVYTKVANYILWMRASMSQPEPSTIQGNKTACKGHRCPLGECLPHSRICNGFMECSDGSDERGCWEPKPPTV